MCSNCSFVLFRTMTILKSGCLGCHQTTRDLSVRDLRTPTLISTRTWRSDCQWSPQAIFSRGLSHLCPKVSRHARKKLLPSLNTPFAASSKRGFSRNRFQTSSSDTDCILTFSLGLVCSNFETVRPMFTVSSPPSWKCGVKRKSDSVSGCVFTWGTILPDFISIRFEMTAPWAFLNMVVPNKNDKIDEISSWSNNRL